MGIECKEIIIDNVVFDIGTEVDIDELGQLYDTLNDYLAGTDNFPGWRKGIYPARDNAVAGVAAGNLYTARYQGKIIGSVILNHEPEAAYKSVKWLIDSDYSNIIVIHTLVVHPEYIRSGIGKALMNFSDEQSKKLKARSIRLDVYEKNTPAIGLYEKCGFQYIDTVDLGLGRYGLDWFLLYEKVL
ncbi:MAG TPA: GNAT family N-acetyltransferase [Mobilitalea sp.]|nr:GNAT family N-acetyltransferase [Mobilitalea sp.]